MNALPFVNIYKIGNLKLIAQAAIGEAIMRYGRLIVAIAAAALAMPIGAATASDDSWSFDAEGHRAPFEDRVPPDRQLFGEAKRFGQVQGDLVCYQRCFDRCHLLQQGLSRQLCIPLCRDLCSNRLFRSSVLDLKRLEAPRGSRPRTAQAFALQEQALTVHKTR